MTRPKYDHDIPDGHPSASTSGRYPNDQRLRRHGFKIHGRPKGEQPVWLLGDTLFSQEEALALCQGMEQDLAKAGRKERKWTD